MRPAALLLAAVFAATAAHGQDKPDKKDQPKPEPGKSEDFTGRVDADTVELRPRVSGYITRIAVQEGDAVKKGDLVAEIDPRPYALELDRAKAKLTRAEAQVKGAEARFSRLKTFLDKGVVSKEEVDDALAALEVAKAEVAVAKAELDLAQLYLAWTKITAPMDGRIGRFHTTVGNLVRADSDLLAAVVRLDPLYVDFDVDERTLLKLREATEKGGTFAVAVGFAHEKDFPHKAEFRASDLRVDPGTGTVRFRATLPNPKGQFLPGLFARVRLTIQPAK